MEEIQLKELFQIVLKRWWLIVAVTLVATIAAGVVSFFVLDPVYQSNTTLYIFKNVDSKGAIEYNELMVGNQLVKDYRELVKSRLVANEVLNKLDMPDITINELTQKINVGLKSDTRVIEISVQDGDPAMAQKIANTVAEVFMDKVINIMKVENVQVIDKAELPKNPVKPNKKMNVAIAFCLGLMIGTGIVFLIEYLDDTLKTPEDVQKHLGLPVIGTIPSFPKEQ